VAEQLLHGTRVVTGFQQSEGAVAFAWNRGLPFDQADRAA
jgi:hypothetical protein